MDWKPDTEVLLQLYLIGNKNYSSRLNGMFAFALWDKEENVLTLAKDRFGEKPLYYFESGGNFAFSSQL